MYNKLKELNETITVFNREPRGYLNIPKGKRFFDMPKEFYINLTKIKDKNRVMKMLNYLVIWYKIKKPDWSKKMADIIAAINSYYADQSNHNNIAANTDKKPAINQPVNQTNKDNTNSDNKNQSSNIDKKNPVN